MVSNVKPKWYLGIGVFILQLLFTVFCAGPLQMKFGMYGLAITEIAILLFGIIPMLLFKWRISEVLPVKLPKLNQLMAIILFLCGSYLAVAAINAITVYLFPQSAQVGDFIIDFYSSVPYAAAILIMSVMPGICEEILHRGLILYTVRNKQSNVATMIIMAIIFGVFHLDPFRFLPTAFLGFMFTFIMIKTDNILLPIIYHTLHNAVTVALSYNTNSIAGQMPAQVVGVCIIISALCPVLFYMGNKILTKQYAETKSKSVVAVLVVLLILLGVIFIAIPKNDGKSLYYQSFTEEVDASTQRSDINRIIINEAGEYNVSFSLTQKDTTVVSTLILENENGDKLWNIGGINLTASKVFFLEAGIYNAHIEYSQENEQNALVNIVFDVKRKK